MNKYKVLLVDDEMLLLESLEIILELNNTSKKFNESDFLESFSDIKYTYHSYFT